MIRAIHFFDVFRWSPESIAARTTLHIESFAFDGAPVRVTAIDGEFRLKVCREGASAQNPDGYNLGMWIFSTLGFLGLLFAYLLRVQEKSRSSNHARRRRRTHGV